MAMLEINNVYKTFNLTGNAEDIRVALDGVSLSVEEGEFITIIGGNGSGKSTLMNIISGVLKPDSGSVLIDGIDVTTWSEYNRAAFLGRVFQDPMQGTAADMSVLENLEIAYRRGMKHSLRWGFKKSHRNYFIEELSKIDLGLETRLGQKVGLMSGGQRQALTLIMATMKNARNQCKQILLLDEHTAALDPKTAKKVLELTKMIVRSQNLTTLMITHNMRDAINYGDRLVMLHGGHILYDVSGEEKKALKPEDLLKKFDEADIKAENE